MTLIPTATNEHYQTSMASFRDADSEPYERPRSTSPALEKVMEMTRDVGLNSLEGAEVNIITFGNNAKLVAHPGWQWVRNAEGGYDHIPLAADS